MPITSASPYVWNFDGDGDWSTAADWTPSGPPPDAANVRIDTPDEHTVTFSSGTTTIRNLYVGNDIFEVTGGTFGIGSNAIASFADKLEVTGGTLELNGASALAAAFDQEGSTVDGSGTLLVSGAATLGSGGVSEYVVETGSGTTLLRGTSSVNASIFLDGGRILENAGALTVGNSDFHLGENPNGGSIGGATIRNDAGATFETVTGVRFVATSGTTAFDNAGTFETTGSMAADYIYCTFTNTGTVSVDTGTSLAIVGGGSSSGSIAVASGATFDVYSAFTVTGSYNVIGATQVSFGPLDLSGATLTALGSDLDLFGGFLVLGAKAASVTTFEAHSGGTIDGSGTLTVTGAATLSAGNTETGTGTTLLEGATSVTGTVDLDGGRVLENAGTLTDSGATFNLGQRLGVSVGGATIKNDAGATFDVDGGSSFNARNGTTAFVNHGTFETTGTAATTVMAAPFTNAADGTVSVQTGTLQIGASGSSAGAITVASGATLEATSGTFTVTGSYNNSGETAVSGGALDLSGATLTALGSDLNVSGGKLLLGAKAASVTTLEFSGGTIDGSGTLTVTGAATLSQGNSETGTGTTLLQGATSVTGIAPLDGGRVLENAGTLTASGGADFVLGFYAYGPSAGGGSIKNDAGATFDIVGGGTINGQSGTTAFVNDGTFETTGAASVIEVGTPLTNDSTGTVSVQTGTLEIQDGGSSAGAISVASGATFDSLFGAFTVTGGYNVSGETAVSGGTLDLSGATLTALGSDLNISAGQLLLGAKAASVSTLEQTDGSGGTLFLSTIDGSGTLTVTGAATIGDAPDVLESGTGTTLLKGATTVTNSVALDGGRVFENAGTLTASANARFDLGYNPSASGTTAGDATIKNDAGATWDVDGGGTYQARNGTTAFVNAGTFETTGAAAATTIQLDSFTNTGTVSVQTGSLDIVGAMTGAGTVTVASGATFTLDASSTSTANTVNIASSDGLVDLTGGSGHDSFSFGGDFTSADTVNGGTGAPSDVLRLTSAGTPDLSGVSHIEQIVLATGTNSLTLTNALVGSADDNHLLTIYGGNGDDTVDASALTTSTNAVRFIAGAGNDSFTGGTGADLVSFTTADFDGSDTVNGGTGSAIDGLSFTIHGYITAAAFAGVSHIERIFLSAGVSHNLTLSDALVASADDGHLLTIIGNSGHDTINASAVLAGDSVRFEGAGAADRFIAGGGADIFYYFAPSDSTGDANGTLYDTVIHFNPAADRFDLPSGFSVASVATVSSGSLSGGTGTFDSDMAAAIGTVLNSHVAVDFHVTAGNLSGHEFLVVNPTGSNGYVSGADYVFDVTNHYGGAFTAGDFV